MASYEQVTLNKPDGAQIGLDSTEKLGFFGATPVARQSLTVTTTATTASTSTNPWGFAGSTQANQIIVAMDEVLSLLATLGLGG